MAACSDRAAASTSGSEETHHGSRQQQCRRRSYRHTPLPTTSASDNGQPPRCHVVDAGSPDNFQTFLTLLTTQLQNQNPLDPLDTNQFTQQLVQFAGVEQQLKTNDQLATLVALQQTAQATQALIYRRQDRRRRWQHRSS